LITTRHRAPIIQSRAAPRHRNPRDSAQAGRRALGPRSPSRNVMMSDAWP
jgi:hypothetical protein